MVDLIAHPFAMLAYGLAANLIGGCMEASSPGKPVNPVAYVADRPYRTALGVIAALAGYGALASTDQLTAISAFAVSYAGIDVLDKIGQAAANRVAGR